MQDRYAARSKMPYVIQFGIFFEANPAIIPIFFVLSPRAQSRGFSEDKKGFSLLSGLGQLDGKTVRL